jgi:hypothetical protein
MHIAVGMYLHHKSTTSTLSYFTRDCKEILWNLLKIANAILTLNAREWYIWMFETHTLSHFWFLFLRLGLLIYIYIFFFSQFLQVFSFRLVYITVDHKLFFPYPSLKFYDLALFLGHKDLRTLQPRKPELYVIHLRSSPELQDQITENSIAMSNVELQTAFMTVYCVSSGICITCILNCNHYANYSLKFSTSFVTWYFIENQHIVMWRLNAWFEDTKSHPLLGNGR